MYGGAGSGKTSFSATASRVPEMSPVLYLDFERGTLPLREWGELDKIAIIHLDSWADTHRFIAQVVRPTMNSRSFPYRTVVFDTIDKLQELIVGESRTANPGNNYKPWTDAYDNVVTLVDAFRRVDGVNLIVITHVDRMVNSVTGETQVGPAFKGNQSGKHMPSKFDFVVYMRTKQEEGRPVMGATFFMPGAITKRRTRSFPDHLINPTMSQIWSLAHNTESADNTNKENA
nr:AAA family ATPase [uncultured Actinomyces sp.]